MQNFTNYKKEISNLTKSIKFSTTKKFIAGKTYIPSAGKIIDKNEPISLYFGIDNYLELSSNDLKNYD